MRDIIDFAYPQSNGFAPPVFLRNIGITENEVRRVLNNPKYKNKVLRAETVSDCMKRVGDKKRK